VKPEGSRSFGIPGCRREDNIKRDLEEVGWGSMGWIYLAWNMDRWRSDMNVVMNFQVP